MCNPFAKRITEREKNKLTDSSPQAMMENIEPSTSNTDPDNSNTNTIADRDLSSLSSMPMVSAPSSENSSLAGRLNSNEVDPKITADLQELEDENVASLREYDVLMGRGSGPNRHAGNIHFRAIVGEVFDNFLEKHDISVDDGSGGSEMARIDPSTKNRLAQAVLDKITISKKGRFLQNLSSKELFDAKKDGSISKLVKARASSIDAASMSDEEDQDGEERTVNSIDYYKIVSEKQVLAKIKQTFRFLRDQNEASYKAEKQRQRARRVARGNRPMKETGLPGSVGNGILMGSSPFVAYSLLNNPHQFGLGSNHLVQQIGLANKAKNSHIENNQRGAKSVNSFWARNIAPVASSSMNMNNLKNASTLDASSANMDMVSLLQPNRLLPISSSNQPAALFQGTSVLLSGAMAGNTQGLENANTMLDQASNVADQNMTKRLLEELTLSRLVHLQKQRDDTISAYLSLGLDANGAAANNGLDASITAATGNMTSTVDSQNLQRLLNNMNGSPTTNIPQVSLSNVAATNMAAAGFGMNGYSNGNTSQSLSLLLQLQNNNNANENHSRRAFNSF